MMKGYTLPVKKYLLPRQRFFLFLILKEAFLMTQVKHHSGVIYHIRYEFSSVALSFV